MRNFAMESPSVLWNTRMHPSLSTVNPQRKGRLVATQDPPIQPNDHGHEPDHPEPRGRRECFGDDADWCVLRKTDDEAGVDHAPQALSDDQARRHECAEPLRTGGVR